MAEAWSPGPGLRGQTLRFLLAGGANTAVTYALFWVLAARVHHQFALALAFAAGICIAYLLNTRYVFRVTDRGTTLAGYPVLYLGTYALNAALVELGVRVFEWPPRIAMLLSIAVVVPASFMLNRWWLLRQAPGAGAGAPPAARWLLVAGLAATFLLYSPGYWGYWLGDDFANLHRAYLWSMKGETGQQLLGLFARSVSEGGAFFRPAIIASLSLDYLHSGERYAGWFLYNHALHLANTLLVAAFVRRLASSIGLEASLPAAVAALVFALSPLLAEGVWWVSARSDASVAFFSLLGLYFWVGPPGVRPGPWALPLLLLPALLFKESAALLPLQAGLVWLATPELRERRRGAAVMLAIGVAAAFLLWRAHLFGSAWQVYGGASEGAKVTERLLAVAQSFWPWVLGWSGARTLLVSCYLGLLAAAAIAALASAPRRSVVLALAAGGGGALLATFLNLGSLVAHGEGGRLFYGPLAFMALALGMACARPTAELRPRRLGTLALSSSAVAALVGLALLWPLLQNVWQTQRALRQTAAALPGLAAGQGAVLLLMPDHVGPVVALRNGQGALTLRPLQTVGLLHRVLPTLPHDLLNRHGQYANGMLARLESANLQHWDSELLGSIEPAPTPTPRWPERIACWSRSSNALSVFPAPSPEDKDTWSQSILAEARARDCLLD